MSFTGEAVRQGNADRFGVGSPGATPRAFVSFDGEAYVITRDALVHITDLANGSGILIQNNSNYNLSTPDPTCGFAYNSRLYFLNRDDFTLQIFDDPLTGDVSLVDFFSNIGIPSAAATDGTTVWIYDSNFDALHTIDPDTAATTLLGTVTFDVTTPANNIGGMFYRDGSLFLLDNGTELMFVIEDPSAATLEATAVDVSVIEFGASQRGVNGGSVHLGEAYMAGGNPDALYRFYNVRWDETIDAVEVNGGGNGSLDLTTVSTDATSFEFAPGYTAPSWLTISGNDLVITGAPDVTSDTDYSPELRAVRSGFNEEKTLTVRVAVAGTTITVPGAPRSLVFTTSDDYIVVSWLTASDNGGEDPSRYDVRIDSGSWISADLDTFYLFSNLSPETEYTIDVAQVNSAGRGTVASATATTDAAPISLPSAPTSLSLSETADSIVATWAAAANNGGEAPSRYDIRIDGGSWIDTELDLTHTFSNLSEDTDYTVDVAQVNSAGRGPVASATVRTSTVPLALGWIVPTVPVGLTFSVTLTSNKPITGISTSDFAFRRGQPGSSSFVDNVGNLAATLTAIAGTNNWRLDITLVGIYDDDYLVRLIANSIQVAGEDEPDAHFESPAFYIDSSLSLTTPSAPTSLSLTETHNSITATWSAAVNNGGEAPSRYDIRIAGGAWIDTGLDLVHVFQGLSPETQYTIDVAQVNSAGRGAIVSGDATTGAEDLVPTTIVEVSGDNQTGTVGTALSDPFVVEVRDQDGDALSGVAVAFAVTGGGGTLSATNVTTNASGRAQSTLTLGSSTGTNTVRASVSGITQTRTFTATAIAAAANLPGQVRGVGVTPLSRGLRLVWDAPDAGDNPIQRYEYQLDGGTWTSTGSDMTMFVLDGLENGTEYTVRLRARTASGVGAASAAVTATPAWPTPREGCYLLDLADSDFTGYTAPQLTTTETMLDADLGEAVNVGLIRIQTDAETDIVSVVVQGSPDGNTQYVHLGEMEIGAGEYHAIRLNDRSVQALRLIVKTASTPVKLHTIEVYAVRVDLSSNVAGFSAEELQLGQNSYRRYDGVLVTSDGLRTVPRVELSLAKLTTKQTAGLTALLGEADFYLLAGLVDRYRVSIATDALRFTGRRGTHSLALSLTGAVDLNTFTLAIEVEGQDISHLWIPEDGITVRRSIDTPQLNTVTTDTLTFALDNENFDFELNQPNNFFLRQSLNRHGRGATVLIEINDTPVFAGFVWRVQSDLQSSRVRVQVVDMFAYAAQTEIKDLGTPLDLEITQFPGAQDLYIEEDPVFPFPLFALPIVPGSVTATMSEDGATVDVEIVDVVSTEGVLSERRAEVDYQRGLMRFEAPPLDAEETTITAQWQIALKSKRLDTLARLTLDNIGILDRIGITPTSLRGFSIDKTPIVTQSNVFSSHGRPFAQSVGAARWMLPDATNQKIFIASDSRLLEYDERRDEYQEVARVPADTSITEAPLGGFGSEIESESVSLDNVNLSFGNQGFHGPVEPGLGVGTDGFYTSGVWEVYPRPIVYLYKHDFDGRYVTHRSFRFTDPISSNTAVIVSADVYNNRPYIVYRVDYLNLPAGVFYFLYSVDMETGIEYVSHFELPQGYSNIAVTPDRIFMQSGSNIHAYSHDPDTPGAAVTRLSSEDVTLPISVDSMDIAYDFIYTIDYSINNNYIRVFMPDGSATAFPEVLLPVTVRDMAVARNRIYTQNGRNISVFTLSDTVNYESLVPFQFDTTDFDSFYFLATNTSRGDATRDTTFSVNAVHKYVRSTDTWSTVLDASKGHPQLAHAFDFVDDIQAYADSRKGFFVIRRSNKTFIFYRSVDDGNTRASIAYINETDDVVTDIHTETYTSTDDAGLPYSMDFVLDERPDGIHVYSFVVRYTSSEATLKIFRERVEPSASETEIFSETFSRSGTVEYPISVSSVILADDRSKFYFVLDYVSEDDDEAGKAELCTVAKDGTGSRTVIKTYDNPLIGARSPVKHGSDYFYLEGGWARRPTDDDDVPDKFYYPNEGGRLIEIESDDTVTDHGIIWRSATKSDSPDIGEDRYNGYGLHNAIVSNMIVYDNSLRVVAGYGNPYRIANNLPTVSHENQALDFANFVQVGWGRELAGKVASFPVSDQQGLALLQSLASLGFANIGVSPTAETDARLAGEAVTDWQRLASIYYRGRNDAQVTLRTAVGSGAVSQLNVDAVRLPDAGEVLFGAEIFAYTSTVDTGGVISRLQGVTRAQHGSTASSHVAGITGVRVDGFIDAGDDSEVYTVRDRALDFINQKNRVTVGLADGAVEASDTDSIDDFGEFALSLGTSPVLFSRSDADWAELLAELYLDSLKEPKEVLAITTRLDLSVEVGQVVVVDIDYRIKIGFKAFVVTQVAHALPQAVTDIQLREV